MGDADDHQPSGRWPPNLLLSHHPDCRPAGVRRVRGAGWRDSDGAGGQKISPGGVLGNRQSVLPRPATGHHTDADGYESVSAYHCVPWCPVRLLDEQAGPRTSGGRSHQPGDEYGGNWHNWQGRTDIRRASAAYDREASTGSASRFYPVFWPDAPDVDAEEEEEEGDHAPMAEHTGPADTSQPEAGQGALHDRVICGDSREVLKGLPDACCDAVITDPPYALSSSRNGKTGFMGSHWDVGTVAHDPAFWAEVLRVAKPGAHLVAFGGTRTVHRLAVALEDAGWEIRDSLYWLHGQGFPKSLDVSKAIDKKAGAEREVVGRRTDRAATPLRDIRGGRYMGGENGAIDCSAITAPATDEAKHWDGWGTALKPAVEPIVLARKPLAEPTVAANVLAYGTGALNIDACRVSAEPDLARNWQRVQSAHQGIASTGLGAVDLRRYTPSGRWPPNTLLSHPDGCRPAGVRRVRGISGGGRVRAPGWRWEAAGTRPQHSDADGYETVDAYQCVKGCPVAALDAQAGPRPSRPDARGTGHAHSGTKGGGGVYGASGPYDSQSSGRDRDASAVSRFFPTFPCADPDPEDAVPYFYTPKASRSERNAGLDGRPERVAHDDVRMNGHGTLPQQTPNQHRPQANHHACVKPLALGRWLTRLVAAPGSVVLDPFCGSGSLSVAAVLEGCHYIAIDAEESYCAIARARIAHAQQQRHGPLFANADADAEKDA